MPKYYETAEFKRLNKKWQTKLKKAGFEDHEEFIDTKKLSADTVDRKLDKRDQDRLKTWSSNYFRGDYENRKFSYEAKQEYYRLAGHFLHEHRFDNQLERSVWELHASGLSQRNIEKKLNKKSGHAFRILLKLSNIMMKKYKVGNRGP